MVCRVALPVQQATTCRRLSKRLACAEFACVDQTMLWNEIRQYYRSFSLFFLLRGSDKSIAISVAAIV